MQLLAVILITLISFFVFAIIGVVLASQIFHIPLQDLLSNMGSGSASEIGALKMLQITQSIGIFIAPAFIIAWLASQKPAAFLGFKNDLQGPAFLLMILVLLSAEPIVAYSGILNQDLSLPGFLSGIENWMMEMEERAMELTDSFLYVTKIPGLLVNLLMIAIIPGIGEELFFRGLLQKLLGKWFKNIHVAVVVTAILFSALHMQFYGFLPRFLLGLLFGYLLVWSGNIWYPILAHTIHNAIPVIGYYLYATDVSSTNLDDVGTGGQAWIWALAGSLFLIIFGILFKNRFSSDDKLFMR